MEQPLPVYGQGPTVQLPPGTIRLVSEDNDSHTVSLEPVPSDDPNDPLNWSLPRKAYNFTLVLAVSAAIFTGLTIQINFWQLMGPELDVSTAELNNALSINFVGLALGCAFFIPFSKKYGRRSTYVLSTATIAATAFWMANMTSVAELYVSNLLQGLAGATNETIVMMTVADLFFVHQRGSMNALYLTMVMIGSFVSPIAAGVQASKHGWRSCYMTLGIFMTVLWVAFLFSYEETKYMPITEGLPAFITLTNQQTASQQDNISKHAPAETETEANSGPHSYPRAPWRKRLRWTTPTSESLWRLFYFPFIVLFTYPHILYSALQYAAGVAWLTMITTTLSIVFSATPYNMNPASLGYMGIGPMVGNIIGSVYAGVFGDRFIIWLAKRNGGIFEPEMRLYLLALPAIVEAAGIILFGVAADKGLHWIYPAIGGAMFGFGLGSIGDAAMTMIIDAYRDLTGEAFVGVAFVRNAVSIGIPFGITPWMARMSLQNIFITCGLISLIISSLFIIFVFFGKRIRIALSSRYYDMLRKEGSLQ